MESAARWLLAMPMYHIGGLSILFRCCLYGTTVYLLENFDLREVGRLLDGGGVTLVSLVPTMLQRLMVERNWRPFPQSLRIILLGGAAAPQKFLRRCLEAGLPVSSTYGLTEAASQVATALPPEVAAKPGTVGKPLPGTEVRIASSDRESLGPGEIVEIFLRSPTVAPGYLQEGQLPPASAPYQPGQHDPLPQDTASLAAALRQAGPPQAYDWFASGDLGYLDAEGDLWVVQRRSDLIVSGGENVYPAEVEQALERHPGVETAFVFGPPDAEWGQRVSALVVPDPSGPPEKEVLLAHLREQLAGYKVPRSLEYVLELPLMASGKIDRSRAAALFEKGEQL
jgi:O-succinylbenzoic acid--CoA ligase